MTPNSEIEAADCDYLHPDRPRPYRAPADWVLIGESGDYYVCDAHFQLRTKEARRGWQRIAPGGFCSCPPVADGLTTFARDCGISEHRALAAPGGEPE